MKLTYLLIFCTGVFLVSFRSALSTNSTAAYSLATAAFLALVALYSVGFLGYKFGGSLISLESKVKNLENEASELATATTSLAKSIYLLTHRDTLFDGHSPEQLAFFDKYMEPVKQLLSDDIKSEVDSDMASISNNKA